MSLRRIALCFLFGWSLPSLAGGGLPAGISLEVVATISGADLVAVRHAGDGSGRLFAVDRIGQIRVVSADGTVLATPFLDFQSAAPSLGFTTWGENGLLGLAFHPDFGSNRFVYVHYTDGARDTVIERYTVSAATPNVVDRSTARVILRADGDSAYHRGGDLHFGRDGYLYISIGDGGGGFVDTCRRGQTLGPADLAANDGNHGDCLADSDFLATGGNPDSRALQAKILRIDVDATTPEGSNNLCASSSSGAANYAVPAGNPFDAHASRCGETWAYGLRNPYRFSIDRQTGDVFIGDVGEGEMEEVNLQPAGSGGHNFGWSLCEGTIGNCSGFEAPILTYTHDSNWGDGCTSITGGYRYRGPVTALRGDYVFGDYCSGKIYVGRQAGDTWSIVGHWTGIPMTLAGFGEDQAGHLYLVEMGSGRIRRFAGEESVSDVIFANGFQNP